MARRLQEIFKIYPDEKRMAALVLGYAILLFSANVLALTASLGLFFEAYDAATLPYTYVLLMVIGPLISLIYLRLNNLLSFSKALLSVHAFLLLSLILLPLILSRSTAPIVRFSLPVYLEVNVTLTYAMFWNLLGRIYNLRQGKRLFPLLSSGEHLATIGAGLIATFFATRTSTTDLYWLGALFMAGAIALLLAINRANAEKMESIPGGDEEQTRAPGLRTLVKEPYVRLLFVVVSLYTISVVMVENLSFAQAEIRFPTAEGMAIYVGLFMAIYGVFGLIVQWLIAGRLLDRFGVNAAMAALPGGLLIFMVIFALVGSFNDTAVALFWLASGANMYAYTLDAPYAAAKSITLQPLPPHLRTQVQTTAMGIAYPLATGLSGLLLLLLINVLGFDSVQISIAVLIVLALWLAAGARLGRVYARRLRQALQVRSLGGPGMLRAADRTTISVLVETLNGPQPAAVLYALDLLQEVAPQALPEHLPALLNYPDDGVRMAALEHIAHISSSETDPEVGALHPSGYVSEASLRLLEDSPNPEVRAAALKTWYVVEPRRASAALAEFGQDAQPAVRQAALSIMCLHDDPALRRLAGQALYELVESQDAADRIMAAGAIGNWKWGIEQKTENGQQKVGNDSGPRAAQCESILPALLGDGDPRVLRAALAAAERVRLPATWPAIIPALAQHSTGPLAVCALAAGREDVLPFLQAACLEPDQDPRILAGIALVCGRIGGPQAIAILEPFLDHADADVRRQALLGLSRCAYQATPQERGSVKERFRAQAARLAEIVAAQVDVGDAQEVLLTADVLEQRRQMGTDNLLLLLSFIDEPQTVLSAREALQPGRFDDEKRAYALEALDILLDHETKALLFPFVKQLEPGQRLAAAHKELPQTLLGRKQRLYTLLQAGEHQSGRWTRVCAIYGLGLLEHAAAEVVVDTAVRFDEDPLLLETALNSLEQHGVSLEEIAAANPALEQAVRCWRGRDPRAMTLLQKAQILKQGSIFAGLPHKALESIAGLMGVIDIDADETIIHKGDPGDSMYVIVEGQLRVHENGRTFDTLGAGGVVGEMALLDAGPRSASVTGVVGGGRLLRLDREPFLDLLAGNPQMARELLGLMSRRLRERTADLAHESDVQNPQPIVRNMPVAGGRPGMWGGAVAQGELMDLNKLFILKCTEFFGRINSDLLERIAVLLEEVDLAGGEALFEEGDPGRSLYIVAAGQVRVHVEGRTLAYAGEGEVLGEMALLDSAPRSASVTGTVPAQLLRLDQRPFFELLEAQPELARGIIKMLSGRLRKRLLELGRLTENGTILPIA